MFNNYYGEIFAILTSFCWTISALSYEYAGKRIGSVPMNMIRMFIALGYMSLFLFITRGFIIPAHIPLNNWIWLLISGLIGFVVGDIMLFQSFVVIGARLSMLVMSLVPPLAAIFGILLLKEKMSFFQVFAMFVTISGIAIVVYFGRRNHKNTEPIAKNLFKRLKGFLLAFGGAAGQAGGLVLSKKGMSGYDAFESTQIRIIAGVIGYIIIISSFKLWRKTFEGLKNKPAIGAVSLGSFIGPFIGVSFSLIALKHTSAGIAATLTSLAPVIIIYPSMLINKEKIKPFEVIGTIISIFGVALFFL
ncbi:MAG: DMT family transporter [Bacteroidales bacterium]|mgnify:CR=1 FL=1|jgi:drug/metabolite transporter (DMT)-like permease|nr:DMT family transporter [Bacteroidales bacterium]HOL97279.1 DMT family transporter [Bacteroidales bacterium]HOM35571.1 DMT family transporter [Bacteroidales bacterium]HPD24451.1 DMT family transporter [Bacteroidales bacterium]HRS98732.1 DMT family transporter [Bacteroidales bacterium]